MRDEDTTLAKPAHEELRDIHRRIDLLVEQIHALEVTVARGSRFPAWAGGLLVLAAVQIGGQVYLNAELRGDVSRAAEIAIDSSQRNQIVPVIEERVKNLEGRIVGNTSEGWHRKDHDLYAQMIDVKLGAIMQHIEHIEARNKVADGNWDKVRARGLLVEPTGGKQ